MNQKNKITKKEFNEIIRNLNYKNEDNYEYLYEVYDFVMDSIYQVIESTELRYTQINHYVVILYILNEFTYSLSLIGNANEIEFKKNDDFFNILSSICTDKYLTNEKLNYKSKAFINRFNVPISTLNLYLNFLLRTIDTYPPQGKSDKLVKDMLLKGFTMSQCILSLLINGFETEAFSTWRTLHENECILLCLMKNGEEMFKEYYKHIKYALAYRGQLNSKEEIDEVFVQIKSEMKCHDLKSKDMKKFIEYGYLYSSKEAKECPSFKLNFRDGVEMVAGLSSYAKVYEMASEIAHSSPLLLYSNKNYFFEITMLNLYETFFRLENVFNAYYKAIADEKYYAKYIGLKQLYMSQLNSIYTLFKKNFINKYNKQTE